MKKIFGFIIFIGIVFSFCSVALAENAEFKILKGDMKPDGTIDAKVLIENNPGISAFVIDMEYDKNKITPISINQSDILKDGTIASNIQQENIDISELNKVTIFGMSLNDIKENGELFVVTFNVVDKAQGETSVTLNYEEKNMCNSTYEEVIPLSDNLPSIDIQTKTLIGIEIISEPVKKEYIEGEELDISGLEVKANYSNGESEVITDYQIRGYDSAQGQKNIEIKYKEFTELFTVTVFQDNEAYLYDVFIDSIDKLDGKFNFNLTIDSKKGYSQNATAIVAIYDKTTNKLISYDTIDILIKNGVQQKVITTDMISSYNYDNSKVKIILWNSKDKMKPLSLTIESDVTK